MDVAGDAAATLGVAVCSAKCLRLVGIDKWPTILQFLLRHLSVGQHSNAGLILRLSRSPVVVGSAASQPEMDRSAVNGAGLTDLPFVHLLIGESSHTRAARPLRHGLILATFRRKIPDLSSVFSVEPA